MLADRITRQVSKDVERTGFFIGSSSFLTFEQVVDSGQELGIGNGTDNLSVGMSSLMPFMIEGSHFNIPLVGVFSSRLGFPFPEFTNFAYDEASDSIRWPNTGRINSLRFPVEGMLTRHLVDEDGQVIGFEMSMPGLRGQSGGPVFDVDGKVWGRQVATAHLDLNFDVDQEVIRDGLKKRVKDSACLHVGHCIHADVLKSFMGEHGIQFQEE